jgi:hypothetical protein
VDNSPVQVEPDVQASWKTSSTKLMGVVRCSRMTGHVTVLRFENGAVELLEIFVGCEREGAKIAAKVAFYSLCGRNQSNWPPK